MGSKNLLFTVWVELLLVTMGPTGPALSAGPASHPAASQPAKAIIAPLPKTLKIDLGSGVKIELVLIPPGSFTMGSENSDSDEKPVHKVTISKPFYLGKYEVTQEQWQAVMGSNPSNFKGPKNPVESVSWEDCQNFLTKLNEKVKSLKFALPTEAQWEYACRAGSTTAFSFGDAESDLSEYAWYTGNTGNKAHPVGGKKPNAWGLYDMHGNVWEWCADWSGKYADAAQADPKGAESGIRRVLRGGSWKSLPQNCRSAYRFGYWPGFRHFSYGLRVVGFVSAAGGDSVAVWPLPRGATAAGPPRRCAPGIEPVAILDPRGPNV